MEPTDDLDVVMDLQTVDSSEQGKTVLSEEHDQIVIIEKPSNTSNHTQDEQAENHTPITFNDPLVHSILEHQSDDHNINTSLTFVPIDSSSVVTNNNNIEKHNSPSSPSTIPTSTTSNNSISSTTLSEQLNTSMEQGLGTLQQQQQQSHFAEDNEELGRYHSLKQAINGMFKNVMNMRGINVQSHRNETPFDIAVSKFPKQFLHKYESAMLEVFIAMQKRESDGFLDECSHYLKERGIRQKLNALDRTHQLNDCYVYMKRCTNNPTHESIYVVITPSAEDEKMMKKQTCIAQLQEYLERKKTFLQEIQNHNTLIKSMNEDLRKKNNDLLNSIQNNLLPNIGLKLSPILSSCEKIDEYSKNKTQSQSSYH